MAAKFGKGVLKVPTILGRGGCSVICPFFKKPTVEDPSRFKKDISLWAGRKELLTSRLGKRQSASS